MPPEKSHSINISNDEREIKRVRRSKAEARETYDRISTWYDLLEGHWEKMARVLGLQKLAVNENEVVLEIGFGTGQSILALAKSVGKSGRVYGIDLSARMLLLTQTRVRDAGLSERVTLMHGDAEHLPFAPEFLDALFLSFTLELFDTPEIPVVLSECQRVLRPDGRICLVSLSKTVEGSNWMCKLYEGGHERFPRFLDCRPIYVKNALEVAGFQIRDATLISLWGLPVEIVLASKYK